MYLKPAGAVAIRSGLDELSCHVSTSAAMLRYDFQFIAEWLIEHGVKPYIIHNGQKIIQTEVKCRFIDSISFTPMPLRDFTKTFGLTEIAKGCFPHKFNTDENQDYTGPYPEKSYYGYDEMKKDEI